MILIGLSGHMRVGKDTTANIIKEFCPDRKIEIIGFALPLKEDISKLCGVSVNFIDNNKSKFRLMMMGYGTDYRRACNGEDYWLNRWLKRISTLTELRANDILICNDVRFANEAQLITELGGYLVRVERDSVKSSDNHKSETELDNYTFPYTLHNNGTLEELRNDIRIFLKTIDIL